MADEWIKDELRKYDRRIVFIGFSDHALKDRGLRPDDIDKAVETVRMGMAVPQKSDHSRRTVCFKRYFENNITCLVIAGLHPDFIHGSLPSSRRREE